MTYGYSNNTIMIRVYRTCGGYVYTTSRRRTGVLDGRRAVVRFSRVHLLLYYRFFPGETATHVKHQNGVRCGFRRGKPIDIGNNYFWFFLRFLDYFLPPRRLVRSHVPPPPASPPVFGPINRRPTVIDSLLFNMRRAREK